MAKRLLKPAEHLIEVAIFGSRWLLMPMYLGMIVAQGTYTWKFLMDLWHLVHTAGTSNEVLFLQGVLQLIDMLMVANLVIMVLIGGYATFVSKLDLDEHEDRPEWLDHIDPGTLKTKLAGALIGISGIHLLQTFTQLSAPNAPTTTAVMWQVIIHLTFVASALVLAFSDILMQKKIALQHDAGHKAG
jgi:uncharacterized protein (TIGR00645 family)